MSAHQEIVEVMPEGSLEVLSQIEVERLQSIGEGNRHEILRQCALAVLNVGSQTDDAREVLERYADFDVRIVQHERGITLALTSAPEGAFVDGTMIRGIRELLFAVVRDVGFMGSEIELTDGLDIKSSDGITNAIFHILRNADMFQLPTDPDMIVCWGGHAIGREEYDYTKDVGYQLGLRLLNVCTGCGAGAMKGPMKGATIGHAKQRVLDGRYIGITEPGIIAAESPNPIVNQLVIMPDIDAGNVLYKSLTTQSNASCAGVIICGDLPLVLTSRGDSARSKLASISLRSSSDSPVVMTTSKCFTTNGSKDRFAPQR